MENFMKRFADICAANNTTVEEVENFEVTIDGCLKNPELASKMAKLSMLVDIINEGVEINPDLPEILDLWTDRNCDDIEAENRAYRDETRTREDIFFD